MPTDHAPAAPSAIAARRSIAGLLSIVASVALAGAMNAPIRLAGPMNLWPPPAWTLAAGAFGFAAVAVVAFHRGPPAAGTACASLLAGVTVAGFAALQQATGDDVTGRYVLPPPWTFAAAYLLSVCHLVHAARALRRGSGGYRRVRVSAVEAPAEPSTRSKGEGRS